MRKIKDKASLARVGKERGLRNESRRKAAKIRRRNRNKVLLWKSEGRKVG